MGLSVSRTSQHCVPSPVCVCMYVYVCVYVCVCVCVCVCMNDIYTSTCIYICTSQHSVPSPGIALRTRPLNPTRCFLPALVDVAGEIDFAVGGAQPPRDAKSSKESQARQRIQRRCFACRRLLRQRKALRVAHALDARDPVLIQWYERLAGSAG